MTSQSRRCVFKIIEWKKGQIFKTKEVCKIWVNNSELGDLDREAEIARAHGGDMLVVMSTSEPYEECYRSI